jgi:hypothetical protein
MRAATPSVLDAAHSIAARGAQAVEMQRQAQAVGGCERPIRVAGRGQRVDIETGEIVGSWSTEDKPDGVLHVRCKDRRASRCKPCSLLYQDDAYQPTRAGLAGGKGVPGSVQAHPAVFVTLTAPSFGLVHSRTTGKDGRALSCRARRDQAGATCLHGWPVTCTRRHRDDDPALGTPLCPDCFDYGGAVAWNHHASELWRRTTIRIYRELASLVGLPEQAVKCQVRLSYVKVAEWQRRGLIHFHAAIRLDARPQRSDDPEHAPPPDCYTLDLLDAAIRAAVAHVTVPYDQELCDLPRGGRGSQGPASDEGGCRAATLDGTDRHIGSDPEPRQRFAPRRPATGGALPGDLRLPNVDPRPRTAAARWGDQLDIRPIEPAHLVAVEDQLRAADRETPKGVSRAQIAGYLAKYATKDTEVLAQLRPGLDIYALATSPMPEHVRRLAVCVWLQARVWHARDERHRRARRWVHQFGYGGHYLTKSRRYSTTFGRLREARRDWHLARQRTARAREAERRITALGHPQLTMRVGADSTSAEADRFALSVTWRLDGIGWRTVGDALLAQSARQRALDARHEAREQRAAERELEAWIA